MNHTVRAPRSEAAEAAAAAALRRFGGAASGQLSEAPALDSRQVRYSLGGTAPADCGERCPAAPGCVRLCPAVSTSA